MARRTRKPSANQRAKTNIEKAKKLKAMGVLSKQTKLHGGKYISRGALKRVQELDWILQNNSKAIPVKSEFAKNAMKEGMLILKSGGRQFTVVPNNPAEVRRVKQGIVSGVVPVPGGQVYTVKLPYNTMSEFVEAVNNGSLDNFKEPKEHFGFTYHGFGTKRSFKDAKALRQWLLHYDFMEWIEGEMSDAMEKELANFHLYRMQPGAWNPKEFDDAEKFRRNRKKHMQHRFDEKVRTRKQRRIQDVSEARAEQIRAMDRERKKASRDRMKTENPKAYADMLRKNAERAKKSQKRKKPSE